MNAPHDPVIGTSTRVYRFGLRPPTENADLVREQMRAAHRYRNVLVEIERGRRAAVRGVMSGAITRFEVDHRAACERLEAARRAVKAERSRTRSRSVPDELTRAVDEAREGRRAAAKALGEARVRLRDDESTADAVARINELAAGLQRNARAHCDVWWGSYLLQEAAMQASRGQPLYRNAEPCDPRFVRWNGDGAVGVQVQGGMTTAALLDARDTRLRVERAPWPERPVRHRRGLRPQAPGPRRLAEQVMLRARVGSTGRDPVWASWPMVLSRELPEGAVVKQATVHRRLVGPHEEWSAEITMTGVPDRPSPVSGIVGVDLGWRRFGEELRVGAWSGDDGEAEEVRTRVGRSLRKVDDLRAIRDALLNVARPWLAELLGGLELPPWLAAAARTLPSWRSQARLAGLVHRWRGQRFPGDEAAYEGAEAWRQRDRHLWTWEAHQRRRALRRRLDEFRCVASRLARRYRYLALEKFDLTTFARSPADEPATEARNLRLAQRLAAPGEFRRCLVNAFGRARTLELSAENTTRECHACHHVEAFDAAAELHRACPACGAVWDQDDNAARNLRERARGELGARPARGDAAPSDSAPLESKWARAKRRRAAKSNPAR